MALATHNETRSTRSRSQSRSQSKPKDNYIYNADEFTALGAEMAQAASQQISQAGNYWERCRTLYVGAQDHGKARDALEALFAAGAQIKGRKAPWYRTYKSILTAAADRGIHVTNDMGMSALQAQIKEAKQQEIENDPEQKVAQDERMVEMFKRLAQGCLNRGIPKKQLAEALKDLEPQQEIADAKDTGGGRGRGRKTIN